MECAHEAGMIKFLENNEEKKFICIAKFPAFPYSVVNLTGNFGVHL